ncbi:LacI family DNA-binding transcriptional regulator [Streptomyces sp. RFCAC02]|uniref:LacI family DNA-binding transcriptional regulator n=1 Tax=Streptomyces sp. RFCAC02 TaxID=2499143 RepID=UPI0010216018|nr:LacI family DNA-binding transcriptional regulator [Streptomyces sp. RFCAC02]
MVVRRDGGDAAAGGSGVTAAAKPTIADVAALAGVSVSAVSKVVNGRGGISSATRERVLDAADKLRWSPSATAVALRGARTRAIGMVAGRSSDLLAADPHFTVLISGIERELAPADYGLLLHIVGEEPDAEIRAYRRLAGERRVDGVILTESRVNDPRFPLLRDLRLPAVLVGAPWREDDAVVPVQAPDQANGIREAVSYLLEFGHRRIAMVTGPPDRVHTIVRRRAFETTLRDAGLRPTRVVTADFTAQDAAAATTVLLLAPADERPTAILYANDTMALAGMNTARRLDFDVPRDVSVIGYDNLPLGELTHPTLSTVAQDLTGLGRTAAAALFRLLGERRPDTTPLPALRPPHFLLRESTAPAL